MRNRNRRRILGVLLLGVVGALTSGAMALPVIVPDFSVNPSGPAFTIAPIAPSAGLSTNILAPPELTFAQIDPVSGTDDVLVMNWQPDNTNEPAQAGWELVFGADPDLTNETISLSINPPGFGGGGPGGGPPGGITHLEIVVMDANGLSAGGWGFNTDQVVAGVPYVPLANDLVLSGIAPVFPAGPPPPPPASSLAQNFMQTVTINVGAGPAAGSATITGGPLGPLVGPNYLIPGGGGNIANAISIQFYENGILAGNQAIPVNAAPGLNNYWDHITVTPEPATMSLLAIGAVAMIRRKRR